MERSQFEALFVSNAQGSAQDSINFTESLNQILAQKEENLIVFLELLFDVLFNTENKTARTQAMVSLCFLLDKKWTELDEEIRKGLRTKLSELFNNRLSDNESIYIFAQLICTISRIENNYQELLDEMITNYPNDKNKLLTFRLATLFSLLQFADFSIFENNYQDILQLLHEGLMDDINFSNVIKSISILSALLDFFPDEKENTTAHIARIHELADNSANFPPNDFLLFWKNVCSLLYTAAADKDFVSTFHDSVFKICDNKNIPSDFKIYPLRSLWGCPGEYDRPVVHSIISLCLKVASEYTSQTNTLPFDLLFVFETCFDVFEHHNVYQFVKQKVLEYVNSDSEADKIVGLCLMRYTVQNLPHHCYTDAEAIVEGLEKCLRSGNSLKIDVACIIMSYVTVSVSSNLIDVDTLFPLYVPLLVHDNPDIRLHATEACRKLLSIAKSSIPGISLMVFKLIDKVCYEDMLRFLMLLGKCVTHDDNVETEIAAHLANFTLAMLNVQDRPHIVCGACYVAECLMSVNEKAHLLLLQKTIQVISEMMQSEEADVRSFGIARILNLMKIFPTEGSILFEQFSGRFNEFLNLDDDTYPIVKQRIVIDIASIEARNEDKNHPFVSLLLDISKRWLASDQPSFIGSAIEALKVILPILPLDELVNTFQSLANVCVNTKDKNIACKSAHAMAFALKHCVCESRVEIAKIGYQVGISYIKGDMFILQGVSPMGTDFDFDLLYELSMMVCELFFTPSDILRIFFPFICSIIERHNNLKTEVMMSCLVSAIENESLVENEILETRNFAVSLLVDDIPLELMCSEAKLLIALLDKKLIGWEVIGEKLNIISNWWGKCSTSRYKMKTTMANVVLLVWRLCFYFDARIKGIPDELIPNTLDQFPPDDVTRTAEMITLAKMFIEKDPDAPVIIYLKIAKSIMKIMTMTQIILKKRGVSPDLIEVCKSLLDTCRNRYPQVQKFVNEFSAKSESRRIIFQQFIA
ncbi:hypothetical protein TRFO_40729 [Tritrichomonas foetus]|uniref:Importin N-terminal domain-containing protein n=1 Tax=Tritrichomonas foetus TaxID=1144522 RepID=A0A1J4J0J5_9EUKA|nr:hypothetical protein TRFO_40729 [Tritrichomonas foetus]|eukprot:OHS92922.1 hypothetical protein TRFO_40729 [Tritrichomonas foetus]